MEKWYRALVALMAVAAMFCTTAVVFSEFQLWHASTEQCTVWKDDSFEWTNGLYEAQGQLEDGVLREAIIHRLSPELR